MKRKSKSINKKEGKIDVLYSMYFKFGNKIYEGDYNDRMKPIFKDVTKQFRETEKLSERIANKIKDKVDVKKILIEAFMHQKFEDLKKLGSKGLVVRYSIKRGTIRLKHANIIVAIY